MLLVPESVLARPPKPVAHVLTRALADQKRADRRVRGAGAHGLRDRQENEKHTKNHDGRTESGDRCETHMRGNSEHKQK